MPVLAVVSLLGLFCRHSSTKTHRYCIILKMSLLANRAQTRNAAPRQASMVNGEDIYLSLQNVWIHCEFD